MALEQGKRGIAMKSASEGDTEEVHSLMVRCSENLDRYHAFIAPLEEFNGIPTQVVDHMSLLLCISNAFAVAFYSSVDNTLDKEKTIDWVVRFFAIAHFADAMFRLSGAFGQPILTTDREKVRP